MDGHIENSDINFYNDHGYVHLHNRVKDKMANEIKKRGMVQRSWVDGNPLPNPVAGKHDRYLAAFYRSEFMYNLATSLLGKDDIWLFNDQVVIKKPNDTFVFPAHTDNDIVEPNKDYNIETINIGVVLDDFTEENGTIEILDQFTNEWVSPYPKKGDLLAIRGNTVHRSGENNSPNSRGFYACVYTAEKIEFDMYYTKRFTLK